ncbi:iron-containing alcohol dehydrogenase [Virgibacillus byunsanensis]|uniref:Iron-containing alcohol dehydrogenase n=1 Tax=Virgibacillus byunsanensis TaxID=570945 RepID=A0ABW3LM27_9BACI
MPNRIVYGSGSFQQIGQIVSELGNKALVISDSVMKKMNRVKECVVLNEEAGISTAIYSEVNTEPTDVHVREAMEICRENNCEVIIAVGGGSCIDTAKAVAVMMTNDGEIGEYFREKIPFPNKPLPLIAIPTTGGTGSEGTKVTVITDTVNQVKMMISQPELLPAVAIVDPLLTLSCPRSITAATGVDALCHALEAYISRLKHPVSDMYALTSIDLITKYLLRAYENGEDIEAREKMSLAAMLAGIAFSNSSVTLVHGMSRPIGAVFHIPHGFSNAMLLATVLTFTKDAAVQRFASIGKHILDTDDGSDEQLADEVIQKIIKLCNDLDIPNMKKWGIDKESYDIAIPKMAADAIASGSPANNPKVPTQEQIEQLYYNAYEFNYEVEKIH